MVDQHDILAAAGDDDEDNIVVAVVVSEAISWEKKEAPAAACWDLCKWYQCR